MNALSVTPFPRLSVTPFPHLDDRAAMTPADSLSDKSWFCIQMARWRQDVEYIVWQVRILSLALRHPLVPWHAKLVAGCAVGYLLSPIQLIPTFIPIIGQMDDILVLFLGMKLLRKWTPITLLAECEMRANTQTYPERGQAASALHVVTESHISAA